MGWPCGGMLYLVESLSGIPSSVAVAFLSLDNRARKPLVNDSSKPIHIINRGQKQRGPLKAP